MDRADLSTKDANAPFRLRILETLPYTLAQRVARNSFYQAFGNPKLLSSECHPPLPVETHVLLEIFSAGERIAPVPMMRRTWPDLRRADGRTEH